ncbi:MBL fold metallo-hydrolase [Carbonactinospora thermoautotrophica]|uniref:Putative hydrolase n=1 Tax=Carbonactinospora thermoautotrophica TaxID=1469144 RepID=A0A132MPV6_9ACTN|nr:MBL fold metallo-hydrolase [Carbonactinospora thermoautotrophica]KWW99890.1 putative hydrolase [Carbonactinospora thermoautotrophica]KWX04403.1 Zn-dependent hydrolase [Carbonactinospora thermoautotrophica]KWX06444.1 Zn-dependent hydrolase [Carbonactinospora thermoautotrophica]MCX9191125.1 MBL fold metallo-hydrolase [Carbonactinospora thermoautotrophica]
MTYHGNVQVGGPPDVRELTDLVITKIAVGPYDNNAYLLRCRDTGEQLLIDAANEPDTLLKLINGELARVVTTHRHADHWQALEAVVSATGARTAAGRYDAEAIPVPTDELIDDGDEIRVGRCVLRAIHLVGHTPGSIALLYDDPKGHPHLFTGDCLFPGGVGNTFGSRENFERLFSDVKTKLFDQLPDETWVYPGHGRDTTLGAERPHLPEWQARGW